MPASAWEDESLDFDEVAKCFSMPVAEAANILGVCQATLKKICRENGLARWPHRKFLGGRSVEEIKREALQSKRHPVNHHMYSTTQPSNLAQVNAMQTMLQTTRTNLRISTTATSRTKMPMPSFLDDFRYGYPSKGLESISECWWKKSSSSITEVSKASEEASKTAPEAAGLDEFIADATKLVNLRKRKAECLAKTIKSPISSGYDGTKVEGKQADILKFVFGEEMPEAWTYALSRPKQTGM